MGRKFLFPVDGSKRCQEAFKWAVDTLMEAGDEIDIVHVQEIVEKPPVMGGFTDLGDVYGHAEEENTRRSNLLITHYGKEAKEKGVKYENIILHGKPKYVIVERINANHYDTVIMGNRGMSNIRSALLGSVSDYVLHHSKWPVIVYRPKGSSS